MSTVVNSPLLFYANMFAHGGVYIYHGEVLEREVQRLRMEAYSRTLTLMSKHVQEMVEGSQEVPEDLIIATLILAAYSIESTPTSTGEMSDQQNTPFAHDPYFYQPRGRPDYCHVAALRLLVTKKGGLDSIKAKGIANLICVYVNVSLVNVPFTNLPRHDLKIASLHTEAPRFPCRWRARMFRNLRMPSHNSRQGTDEKSVLNREKSTIAKMRRLLAEVASPPSSDTSEDSAQDLNCAYNEVQHNILTLPRNSFRTAALLLSDVMFFTAPRETGIRERLLDNLRSQLPSHDASSEVNFWMATIGALASDSEEAVDPAFINLIAEHVASQGLSDIDEAQDMLSDVAWRSDIPRLMIDTIWERARERADFATGRYQGANQIAGSVDHHKSYRLPRQVLHPVSIQLRPQYTRWWIK